MDDTIDSHDVPHDDMANHNCSWGLQGDQSEFPKVSEGQAKGRGRGQSYHQGPRTVLGAQVTDDKAET
jgi:hypothetical protein